MTGFTDQALRRDKARFPYAHLLTATDGSLLIETVHGSLASLRMEVEVSASRIRKAEPNRGGQVPGRIDVDGLETATWQAWIEEERRQS